MTMHHLKIEKNIPIPKKERPKASEVIKERKSRYPFKDMEISDSFFVPCEVVTPAQIQAQVSTCARLYSDRHGKGWEFKTVRYPDGVRIWRIY